MTKSSSSSSISPPSEFNKLLGNHCVSMLRCQACFIINYTMIDWIQSFSQILQSLQSQNNFNQINAQHLGYSIIALIWYTILWLKYISYISVNKWLREGSMSNPPPLITRSDDGDSDNGKGRIKHLHYV